LSVPSPSSQTPHPARRLDSWLAFVLGAVVLVAALAAAASAIPPRFRWLGLLAVLIGLLAGRGLIIWSRRLDLPVTRMMCVIAFLGGVGSWVGTTAIHVRARQSQVQQVNSLARAMAEQAAQYDPSTIDRSTLDHLTNSQRASNVWLAFIRGRVPGWPAPWPEVLWLCECLAAGLAAFSMAQSVRLGNKLAAAETPSP